MLEIFNIVYDYPLLLGVITMLNNNNTNKCIYYMYFHNK